MPRPLAEALQGRPLFFEPVPPSARATPARAEAVLAELAQRLAPIGRLDALDVPELIDENHDGRPYYRSGDTRGFARSLGDLLHRDVVVNKVVAHLPSQDAVAEWVGESTRRGVHHLVLVGGSSRYIPYPGPSVLEANRIAAPLLPAEGRLGNIAIPQRPGEAHRMLAKTRAGCRFFTTQILFDAESAVRLLSAYETLCRQAGLAPATFLLSVAPLADEGDAEFVRWLGADIPESAERAILNGEEASASHRSIDRALAVYQEVRTAAAAQGLEVPIGVNVEQISQRHLASAVAMLVAFAEVVDAPPATTA